MTPGSHHMIMFWGTSSQPADGTLDPSGNCGGQSIPVWIYASQTPTSELDMPADDGTGKPLGMNVPANQPAYFQMHYLNQGDQPLTVHVTINAFAYDASVQYTTTAAYITYNEQISIPNNSTSFPVTATCSVPTNATFWTVSTHSHKHSVKTQIDDASTMVFQATDWEHPGAKSWMTTPFYTFASGKLTYTCWYDNMSGGTIVDGPSAQTNEMCMATGYFFPATSAKFCLTNQGPL